MKIDGIVTQISDEFSGMGLVTPTPVITKMAQRAINYWNIWSGFPKIDSVPYTGVSVIDLSTRDVNRIIYLFPAQQESLPFAITPVWSLFGFDVLDRMLEEVAVLWYYIKGLKMYLGKDFRWRWESPYLMVNNVPQESTTMVIVYYKRILDGEDILEQQILDWILRYTKALVLVEEGRRLRKAKLVGIDLDGSDLVNEGKEEMKDLEQRLKDEAVIFVSRF